MLRFDKKRLSKPLIHSLMTQIRVKTLKCGGGGTGRRGVGGIFLVLKEFFLEVVWPPP